MEENVMDAKTPLTTEEKFSVRDAQVNLANIKDQANQQIQNAAQILQMLIDGLAKKRNIPQDGTASFKFDTLEFVNTPRLKAGA
jgi:hypothetical protein